MLKKLIEVPLFFLQIIVHLKQDKELGWKKISKIFKGTGHGHGPKISFGSF